MQATDGSSIVQPTGAANISTRKQGKTPATAPNAFHEEVTNQLHAVGQAFPCLLNGLERLDRLPQGRTLKGQIIWSFVKIFHDVLECICYLSATRAYGKPIPMPAKMQTRAQALQHSIAISDGFPAAAILQSQCQACHERNIRCDGGVPECQNCREAERECKRGVPLDFVDTTVTSTLFTPPTKYVLRLCEFAIVLIAHLDTTKTTHEEVMEGFLFSLLRRLGQGLKSFTIGNQADWGAEEDESQAAADNRGSETQAVMEAQAPCLIWIFEQAQAFVTPRQTTQIPKNARRGPSAASRKSLSTIEQNRFQNTLLKAVFGDRVSAEYRPALTPPSSPLDNGFFGRLAVDLKERDMEVKDWFKYEVWRLVGWDCLRGKMQWDKD